MDILLNNGVMPIVLVTAAIGLIAYSTLAVHQRGAKAYFGQLGRGAVLCFVLLGKFLVKAVGLLAQSARKFDKEDATANSVRGGRLNYRTGKLDDGTDPAGWYEKD